MYKKIVQFIRESYATAEPISLHAPVFAGNEKKYLCDCLDSTYVSSIGQYVEKFEQSVAAFTGAGYGVAVVNGTQALFIALTLVGARPQTEVITQALTFVATPNAISYTGARPVFIDVDRDTLGMSAESLGDFLVQNTFSKNGRIFNRLTNKEIVACVPMHTMGHPCKIETIKALCDEYGIPLIEDAAESLGSLYLDRHTGTFGVAGVFSFNGNKIITTGGGGMLVTDNEELAGRAKHITTTAKVTHPWEFFHDQLGYNFRLPNLNAALGVAQMEKLPDYLARKRELALQYKTFFKDMNVRFMSEPPNAVSNYWLNTLLFLDKQQRDAFLKYSNAQNIQTRPLWRPMHHLPMYEHCEKISLKNTEFLYERCVNIPSGVRL